MKLSNLIYKRKKISILGLCLFLVLLFCKYTFKITKVIIENIIKVSRVIYKAIKSYYLFYKSGYCYADIEKTIKKMTGREFEIFMYLLFKELGYKAKLTETTGDGGKDIILKDKFGDYIYVECKRWNDLWNVGRPELQKLVGSAYGDCIEKMIFVTTGDYSNDAVRYSIDIDNLKLWDMSHIMRSILKINKRKIPYILSRAMIDDNVIELNPIEN